MVKFSVHVMNCREAQHQLFAEGDGAPASSQRAALDEHVGHCPDCRRIRDDLTAALTTWRSEAARTPVPDAMREWHAVRRLIRGGAEAGAAAPARPRRNFLPWLAVPVGAAAALALALYIAPSKPASSASPLVVQHAPRQVARADAVEVPGGASTIVFVDDKSGWLIVQASDARRSTL